MKYSVAAILLVVVTISVALGNTLPTGKPYPEFQIGVTGLNAAIKEGVFAITQITPDTPAEGRLKAGDVLLAVNGTSLEIQDPRHPLGEAINKAEGSDGRMVFKVRRDGKEVDVSIKLRPIGSYSKTWPLNCKKSQTIITETAEFILKAGPRSGYTGSIDGLFLLSTGIPKYRLAAKKWAHHFATGTCGSHTWNNGYLGLFLGEYYLATGDKSVLPTLKALCDDATKRQYYGGWNHWDDAGPGYVQGGLMNPAGVQVLTSLILARECGVKFDESTYDKALTYFFRFAGHGGVSYGNHPPEGMVSNGKNGMLACALTLLPDKKFQDGSQILALAETDTYYNNEGGHGSHFGNVMWRGIAGTLVPQDKQQNYRRHMDALMWYYDLCRLPQGGFWMLPQPNGGSRRGIGNSPNYSAGMVGLTYTAPLKTLRITGKPRTRYSKQHKPTKVEESLQYTDFYKNNYVAGGDDGGMAPHEIMAAFEDKATPIEWCWKMMHHYQPEIRLNAAVAMGDKGSAAVPYILKALKSNDARLRQAGLNAIHGIYQWWFYRISKNNGITQNDVTGKFLPHILKPLKDPDAPMWEKVSALWALGKADSLTVKANVSLIREHLKHDDWWVRVAAWSAAKPLMADATLARTVLDDLLKCYANDLIVHPYRSMMGHLKTMHMQHESLREEIIAGMARAAREQPIIEGYKVNVYVNKIYEPLRYINMKRHPEHVVEMLEPVQRMTKVMRGQQCAWLLTGARWGNIGLVNCANKMGKDAAPVVATIKAIIPDIEKAATGKQAKMINEALAAARACVETYEAKYGRVKPAPDPRPVAANDPVGHPNVVVILADDLGCGDMSLYDGWIKTPRIDRMAAEGVRFTDFHSNSSVCSPTRAALLTGRYQQRVGIIDVIAGHLDTPGLEATELTIPRLMKQNGYKTALFGKWHLGGEPGHNPTHHGFDEFVGFLPGACDFHSHRRWMDGSEVKEQEGYSTDIITDRSVDFIKRNKNNSFFLYVSHQAVHNPYQTPDDTVENRPKNLTKKEKRDRNRLRPKYKIMLEELDKGVGKILDTLKKLDLDENTFVFFLSDNGAVHMNPNVRPYRGGKFSNYEGGHRVPAVARWPGRIEAGWTSDELCAGMDLLPTIMDVVGIDVPQDRTLDGISLKAHLLNQADLPDRRVFFGYEPKLGTAMRDGNWKMQTKGDVVELYDLSQDIKETTNLAERHPKRTKAMKAAIDTWKQEVTRQSKETAEIN